MLRPSKKQGSLQLCTSKPISSSTVSLRCCAERREGGLHDCHLEADVFEHRVVETLCTSKNKATFIVYLEADIFEHSVLEMLRSS